MPNGLFTHELVLEVAEATRDSVITAEELSSIMGVITGIFMGTMIAVFVGMLMKGIIKGFTEETGIKTRKIAGVLIPAGFGG